jgi:hypothetical protein
MAILKLQNLLKHQISTMEIRIATTKISEITYRQGSEQQYNIYLKNKRGR